VLYPIALLLLMLVRPQGLLGTVEWGFFKDGNNPIGRAKAKLGDLIGRKSSKKEAD
jgi:hypothetical protein